MAGSGDPEIFTFDRRGILLNNILFQHPELLRPQKGFDRVVCCGSLIMRKKKVLGPFFILQSKFELRMSGSVSFTVKHFAPTILTKYYNFLSNSGVLGKL